MHKSFREITTFFSRMHEHKNCTIPSWLNFEAEKAGINFSATLQAALKAELHLK